MGGINLKKIKKKRIALLLATITTLTFNQKFLVHAYENNYNSEEKLWLPDFTDNDRAKQLEISKLTEKVNLNSIALERIKNINSKQIIENVSPAKLGDEIVKQGDTSNFSLEDNSENIKLPSNVDNSQTKYFPNIGSQGSLASCASYATAYYTMTYMTALVNDWSVKDVSGKNIDSKIFSPKWSYNFINDGKDAGAFAYQNYNVFKTHGCATLADFPYVGLGRDPKNYREWAKDENIWRNATKYQVDEILRVNFNKNNKPNSFITSNKDSNLDDAKRLLLNGYILNFYTWFSDANYKQISNDPSTKDDDSYVNQKAIYQINNQGAHEMTIVGYNDNIWIDINSNGKVDDGEKGAFKIANSHGPDYANNGFVWMAYDALNKKSSVLDFTNSNARQGAFLNNEAEYVVISKKETPSKLVRFTMQHDNRKQLQVSLVYEKNGNKQTVVYSPLLSYSGGDFPLDGVNNGSEITFVIDLAHLEKELNVSLSSADKIYLQIKDNLKDDKVAIIKSIILVDNKGHKLSPELISKNVEINGDSKMFDLGQIDNSSELYLQSPEISTDKTLSNNGKFNINVSVPPNNSATKLELFENNVPIETKDLVRSSELQNINFDMSDKKEGFYTYFAVLEDGNGKCLKSEEVNIIVDSIIPPSIKISPNPNKVDVEVIVPAMNNAKTLNVYMDGQKIVNEELSVRNPNEVKKSFVLYSLIVGTHTFWAEVEDENATISSQKVSITID
ncbi:C1 family peptidase [Clostridioides difficile]|uniref:C1 family peptidase n=1 Tax=Clostridioides difficile TaxID=1496 RepID=UPI00254F440D|nr:C1 family peptidase [Clostridioides difficile]MDL0213375.1 C1 family peptidase [Clostridioides difficile]